MLGFFRLIQKDGWDGMSTRPKPDPIWFNAEQVSAQMAASRVEQEADFMANIARKGIQLPPQRPRQPPLLYGEALKARLVADAANRPGAGGPG